MRIAVPSTVSTFGLALAVSASVAIAAEPKAADLAPEPSMPDPPKITHENLYQMEELAKQGADPNAHYFLYPGIP